MKPYVLIIAALQSVLSFSPDNCTILSLFKKLQVSQNPTPTYMESPALCFLILLPSMSRIPAFLIDIP